MTTTVAGIRARFPRAFGPPPGTRALRWLGAFLFVAWLCVLCIWFDITPSRLSRGISGLFVILRQMIPPSPGQQWPDILQGLAESVAMAFLGTFVAAVIAVPLGFLGARNVLVNALAHFSIRRVFDGFRGVDQLIWALAFVRAVGLGPLAGVLAITAAEICVLAKLFAEAFAPACNPLWPDPAGAARAAGADPVQLRKQHAQRIDPRRGRSGRHRAADRRADQGAVLGRGVVHHHPASGHGGGDRSAFGAGQATADRVKACLIALHRTILVDRSHLPTSLSLP
jgi:ABC-type phosphate/phosphonate transport system permease subunit